MYIYIYILLFLQHILAEAGLPLQLVVGQPPPPHRRMRWRGGGGERGGRQAPPPPANDHDDQAPPQAAEGRGGGGEELQNEEVEQIDSEEDLYFSPQDHSHILTCTNQSIPRLLFCISGRKP